jgi:coatomer protein complex subunit alpha (xenin)
MWGCCSLWNLLFLRWSVCGGGADGVTLGGAVQVVEMAYQRTKNFERLSFLYLLTGNTDKLRKMLKIAEMRNDSMSRFHNALYLGDAAERVKVLEQTGMLSLAYACALTHGLTEEAERLVPLMEAAGMPIPEGVPIQGAQLLQPPTPILRGDNWPLLPISNKSQLEGFGLGAEDAVKKGPHGAGVATNNKGMGLGMEADLHDDAEGAWGDDLDLDEPAGGRTRGSVGGEGDKGWGLEEGEDDLDLGDLGAADAGATGPAAVGREGAEDGDVFIAPPPGTSCTAHWCDNSSHAADHAAAGSFETAMQLLNRQIAAVNFEPLKPHMQTVYTGAYTSLPGLPLAPSVRLPVQRNAEDKNPGSASLPAVALRLAPLVDELKQAYKAFQVGKFAEALASFDSLLAAIPLVVVDSRGESNEVGRKGQARHLPFCVV